ncbi:hypothetical protein BZA77DRAFT_355455 [Pyronema omphalodes]|nr:hypothetical protein BZA77DRAFT_355455 [Pyronema omphalodes]
MVPNRNNTWPKPCTVPFLSLGQTVQRSPSPQRIRERIPDTTNQEQSSFSISETSLVPPTHQRAPQAFTTCFQNTSLGSVSNHHETPGLRRRDPIFHAVVEQSSDEEEDMGGASSDDDGGWEVVRNERGSEKYNPLKLAKKRVEKEVEKAVGKVNQVLKRKRDGEEGTDSKVGVREAGGDEDGPYEYEDTQDRGWWYNRKKVRKVKKKPEETTKRRERTGWLKYFE